jgi:hypothetical protein
LLHGTSFVFQIYLIFNNIFSSPKQYTIEELTRKRANPCVERFLSDWVFFLTAIAAPNHS